MHQKLCELLAGTRTGEILALVNDNCKEFYQRYLHDFVKSVHQVLHDKPTMEYEVCCLSNLLQLSYYTNHTFKLNFR